MGMIQGIIQQATYNGQMHMQMLEKVAKNVANYATTGYKAERFDLYLGQDNGVRGVTRKDTTPANALITRREFDIAIETPNAYFPVTQPDGTMAYTRDGRFSIGKDGYISTAQGDLLAPGIKIPPDFGRLILSPDGSVQIQPKKEGPKQEVGKIQLLSFTNPEGLKSVGDNKFMPTEASGEAVFSTQSKLAQGKLESSNVDLYDQIESVMRLNAGVLSNYRVIKYSDELFRQAVNLRQ